MGRQQRQSDELLRDCRRLRLRITVLQQQLDCVHPLDGRSAPSRAQLLALFEASRKEFARIDGNVTRALPRTCDPGGYLAEVGEIPEVTAAGESSSLPVVLTGCRSAAAESIARLERMEAFVSRTFERPSRPAKPACHWNTTARKLFKHRRLSVALVALVVLVSMAVPVYATYRADSTGEAAPITVATGSTEAIPGDSALDAPSPATAATTTVAATTAPTATVATTTTTLSLTLGQPGLTVHSGEFLALLSGACDIPAARKVPPGWLFPDLKTEDPALWTKAFDAWECRIILSWPPQQGDEPEPFNAASPISTRTASEWVTRAVIRLLPLPDLSAALSEKPSEAERLRLDISILTAAELESTFVRLRIQPQADWAISDEPLTRRQAAELLVNLRRLLDVYLG